MVDDDMKLTEQEKRIKLAESQGLTSWEEARCLPDYFSDLNAVHELEKVMRPPKQETWCLWEGYCRRIQDDPHATAAQRAEALGLALNLW